MKINYKRFLSVCRLKTLVDARFQKLRSVPIDLSIQPMIDVDDSFKCKKNSYDEKENIIIK